MLNSTHQLRFLLLFGCWHKSFYAFSPPLNVVDVAPHHGGSIIKVGGYYQSSKSTKMYSTPFFQKSQRLSLTKINLEKSMESSNTVLQEQPKVTQQEKEDNERVDSRRRTAPNKFIALQWVVESVEKNGGSSELVNILKSLQRARTKQAKLVAEQKLRSLDLSQESTPVLERLIKACATSGLTFFSLSLLKSMIKNKSDSPPTLPSVLAYGSVLNGLRKMGKIKEMKILLNDLTQLISTHRKNSSYNNDVVGDEKNNGAFNSNNNQTMGNLNMKTKDEQITTPGLNIVAFNSYLAALCDNILSTYEKKQIIRGKRRKGQRGKKQDITVSNNCLKEAISLVIDPMTTKKRFCLETNLDLISYNTALAAASRAADHLAVKAVYVVFKQQQELQQHSELNETLMEDIFTYNALLRDAIQRNENKGRANFVSETSVLASDAFLNLTKNSTSIIHNVDDVLEDTNALQLVNEILSHPTLKPDRFTIDLALLPLSKNRKMDDITRMLTNYYHNGTGTNSSDYPEQEMRQMSEAFSAFLFTLVQGDELSTGRSIFERFLLGKGLQNNSNKTIPMTAKQFNILMEGYLREMENAERKVALGYNVTQEQDKIAKSKSEINQLFDTMIDRKVPPDVYTLTSMLAMQRTSSDITALWKRFVQEFKIRMTPPVYHSLITAYGKAKDPSRACYVFDAMVLTSFKGGRIRRTLASWNTILAVFADKSNCCVKLNFDNDQDLFDGVFSIMNENGHGFDPKYHSQFDKPVSILKDITGMTCMEASQKFLSMMNQSNKNYTNSIPSPNSQSYCYVATSLSHAQYPNATAAMLLFQEALDNSIPPDGRFVNAIIRCFGSNIDGAISSWKKEIGRAVTNYNKKRKERSQNQNLIAAYHGLFCVCGQAGRSDIAVRLTYAMGKEGLIVTETALRCYEAGKKNAEPLCEDNDGNTEGANQISKPLKNAMFGMYESILEVECSKYDQADKRRANEKRVRIIY